MPGLTTDGHTGTDDVAGRTNGNRETDHLRYFFIHLMKTAGTSFAFQLHQQFSPEEMYPAKGLDRGGEADIAGYVSISRMLRLSSERRETIRMYTGHFPYIATELLGIDVATLTMLRDPVARTISVLKHFKRLSPRYQSFELADIYDDPFVFAHFIENHQTRMFGVTAEDAPEAFGSKMNYWATAALLGIGPKRNNVNPNEVDRERAIAAAKESRVDDRRFEIAKRHLSNVDVIGFSERYDEFIEELRERFGWWPSGLNTRSRANESSEAWQAPDALGSRIEADNAYDIQLYEYARELVAQRQAAKPASVPASAVVRSPQGAADAVSPAPPTADMKRAAKKRLRADIRARHPKFFEALFADARIAASYRGERSKFRGRADALVQSLRLMWVTDAFLALSLYRAKARLQALGIPVLPSLCHRLAMTFGQVCIGDPVVVEPGIYLAHGQVVIDGFVQVQRDVVIFPWVTIGLRAGDIQGPTIQRQVHIGTGAKVIGPVTVHQGARIGANAVVIDDVPKNTTVVGMPARPVDSTART